MQRWLDKGGSKSVERLHKRVTECHAIYIDGKRSESLFNCEGRLMERIEDQFAVIAYPNEEYLGYIVAESSESVGMGKRVADELADFLDKFQFTKTDILALGGDGCATNTGMWSGSFRCFEIVCFLNRFFLLNICSKQKKYF